MHRTLVGSVMVAAPTALAISAIAAGISVREPVWWRAAVHLAVLGGIVMMIYAVNIRIVPVFARRNWRSEQMLFAQVASAGAGAWLSFVGIGLQAPLVEVIGQLLALAGGLLFTVNIVSLFRQPALPVPPGAPADSMQVAVDRIATRFMRLSSNWLLLGLLVGVVQPWWDPTRGRWDLVWAHMLLVGFFLSMAAGVCYHVLPRWTGRPWSGTTPMRVHFLLIALGLPVMVLALATDWMGLFLVAGPIQAVAIFLFLATIAPQVIQLPGATRMGTLLAGGFLAFGLTLAIIFAIDAGTGARLRQTHAIANLFGWSGLLISAFGYRFLPGFAGAPMRWPRLVRIQIAVLATGCVLSIAASFWRVAADGPDTAVIVAQTLVAIGVLGFAIQVAATFLGAPSRPVGQVMTPSLTRP